MSPSSLQMREACPLWATTGEAGEAAARGTLQHAVTEDGEDREGLTDEEIAAALECIEFADSEVERLSQGGKVKVLDTKEEFLPVDRRMWSVPVFNHTTGGVDFVDTDCTTGGFADRVIVAGDYAHVMDWKFGKWPVEEAQDNVQGIAYVVGTFRKYRQVKRCQLTFKLPHQDDLTTHTFHRSELPELYLRIKLIVERAVEATRTADFSKAFVNVPACLFCARLTRCEPAAKVILNVGHKYYAAEIPENIDPDILHDPKDVAKGLRIAQIVKTWAEGYRSMRTQQILEGTAEMPPGFVFALWKGRRKIVDEDAFRESAKQFLTDDEYVSSMKPGLTAVENIISEKAPRGQKTSTVREFKDCVQGVERGADVPYLKAVPTKKKDSPTKD